MAFKSEKLEVWQLAVAYTDGIYAIAEQLPRSEDLNLKSQMTRAANSVALNIAEGSSGQTDHEQARFAGYAIRSLIEVIGCLHLIRQRGYSGDGTLLRGAYQEGGRLFARLPAFRSAVRGKTSPRIQEDPPDYDPELPF
jgi:four helix bundle protein